MKRVATGLACVALAGLAACAFAARMDWNFTRMPNGAQAASNAASVGAAPAGSRSVNGSQPLIPGGTIKLVGDIIELAGDGAPITVTINAGARSYTASVQGSAFQAQLYGGESNDMVSVEVHSTRVHYESVLGSLGRLHALAGADQQLVTSEHAGLRVSPYSTALSWLVKHALGGRIANTDAEFELGLREVDDYDVIAASYLLSSSARGTRALPAGYADGYALLRNRTYFVQLLESSPYYLEAANYLASQAAYIPVSSLQQLPDRMLLASELPAQEMPMNAGSVFLIERQNANTFDITENVPMVNPRYSAVIDGAGAIRLQPVGTLDWNLLRSSGSVLTRRITGITLRLLYRGARYSQWSIQRDYVQAPGTAVASDYFVYNAINLDDWTNRDGWQGMTTSLRTLPWICVSGTALIQLNECEYAQYQPTTQSTSALVSFGNKINDDLGPRAATGGPSYPSWNVDANGVLQVSNEDSQTSFWRVDGGDRDIGTVVYKARSIDPAAPDQVKVGISFTIRQRDPSQHVQTASGEWQHGGRASSAEPYGLPLTTLVLARTPDGRAQSRTIYDYSTANEAITWQTAFGGVIDRYYYSLTPDNPDCERLFQYGITQCTSGARYFRPLLRTGQRYYGLEEYYVRLDNINGTYSIRRTLSTPVFYDCLSGDCTGNTGMSPSASQPSLLRPAFAPVQRTPFQSRRAVGLNPRAQAPE